MEALSIMDLRMVEKCEPEDAAKPPPAGACTIVAKKEGRHAGKILTFEPDAQHVTGAFDGHTDVWWLRHVMSAVPDHAVHVTMRRFRSMDTVPPPPRRPSPRAAAGSPRRGAPAPAPALHSAPTPTIRPLASQCIAFRPREVHCMAACAGDPSDERVRAAAVRAWHQGQGLSQARIRAPLARHQARQRHSAVAAWWSGGDRQGCERQHHPTRRQPRGRPRARSPSPSLGREAGRKLRGRERRRRGERRRPCMGSRVGATA